MGRARAKAGRDAQTPRLAEIHVTAPAFLLEKATRLLPGENGELRAADGNRPTYPAAVERYLVKAFGARPARYRCCLPGGCAADRSGTARNARRTDLRLRASSDISSCVTSTRRSMRDLSRGDVVAP